MELAIMQIIEMRPFNSFELEVYDVQKYAIRRRITECDRRTISKILLSGPIISSAPLTSAILTGEANAQSLSILIEAFFEGIVEFLKKVVTFGETVETALKLFNNSESVVSGPLSKNYIAHDGAILGSTFKTPSIEAIPPRHVALGSDYTPTIPEIVDQTVAMDYRTAKDTNRTRLELTVHPIDR